MSGFEIVSRKLRRLAGAVMLLVLVPWAGASAQPPDVEDWLAAPGRAPIPSRRDGAVYRVTRFELRYGRENPAHPPLSEVLDLEVRLGWTIEGYVAPRAGVPTETVRLSEVSGGPRQLFHGSAIRAIDEAIFAFFNERGIQGVQVVPDPADIEPRSNRDLRPEGRTVLTLVIWTGQLEELRTFASGERIPEEQRIDNPAHQRIKDLSPIQPGGENSLLRKDLLDDYVAQLNRHPGRSVDIALSAANEPGGVYLDYLVAENKPWTAYAQASNTGTDATTDWRERFGFVHNQLTGHDDILTLDYVTGNFDSVHAVFGSYDVPFYGTNRARFGVDGAWSRFDASQVGSTDFKGKQWNVGAGPTVNVFQWRNLFVDLAFEGRFYNIRVKESGPNAPNGNEDFVTASPTLSLDWTGQTYMVQASFSSETNLPHLFGVGFDGTSKDELGRQDTSDSFTVLRAEAYLSTYLEPLLFRKQWEDPSTPSTSTLAHEIVLDASGQYTPDDKRLVPQFEDVAGGLYTVRGYDQSVSAGDHSALASLEYRLHIPRLLGIDPTPLDLPLIGSFKLRGQQVYDQPDWDFLIRPFFDFGYIRSNKASQFDERSSDLLLGTGVGVEFSIRRNLIIRGDWGHSLNAVNPHGQSGSSDEEGTSANHDAFYFSATISY